MYKKNKKKKVGVHEQISFRSFKKYSADWYGKALGRVIFPNYEKYSNVNKTYNDFFHKLIEEVNIIAPLKTIRLKTTSGEWLDRENREKTKLEISEYLFFLKSIFFNYIKLWKNHI